MKICLHLLLLALITFEGLPPNSRIAFFSLGHTPIAVFTAIDDKCYAQIPLPNPVWTDANGKIEVCVLAKNYRIKVWK